MYTMSDFLIDALGVDFMDDAYTVVKTVNNPDKLFDPDVMDPLIDDYALRHFGLEGARMHATFMANACRVMVDPARPDAAPAAMEFLEEALKATRTAYVRAAYAMGVVAGVWLARTNADSYPAAEPVVLQ